MDGDLCFIPFGEPEGMPLELCLRPEAPFVSFLLLGAIREPNLSLPSYFMEGVLLKAEEAEEDNP